MKKLLGVFLVAFSVILTSCTPNETRLAQRCQKSTVLLHMKVSRVSKKTHKTETGWGSCTGVYVSPHVVLTANHCVDMEDGLTLKEIWVGNYNGDSAKATILRRSPSQDLALIKTSLKGTPVRLGRSVEVGETIWIVGNPVGLEWIVTKGIVSALDLVMPGSMTRHFVTDATVLPGNSGGPAFDNHGRLIGIVVRSTSMMGPFGASGLGIVVDIHEVRHFLNMR